MDSFLVDYLKLASIEALPVIQKKYPELDAILNKSQNLKEDWAFFMVTGGLGLALEGLPEEDYSRIEILDQAKQMNPLYPAAVSKLFSFLSKRKIQKDKAPHVGLWILMNLNRAVPDPAVRDSVAPVIGAYLAKFIAKFKKTK